MNTVVSAEAYPSDGRSLIRSLRVLLHMFGQVSLLRVGLAAILADVRLEMLGLFVFGDML